MSVTSDILSTADYNNLSGTKTIINGKVDGSMVTLDGAGSYYGFYVGHGITLSISSLTFTNFSKNAANFYSRSNGNGGAILVNGGTLYITGDIFFISNTCRGGGGSFDAAGGDCGGLAVNVNSNIYISSVTLTFSNNRTELASGQHFIITDLI